MPLPPRIVHQPTLVFLSFAEKQGNSQRDALPPCSVVQSPILLGEGMFELPESEFVMIQSKAEKMLPKQSGVHQTKARRGQIKQPLKASSDKSQGDDLQSNPRSMAARKTPFVSRT